MSCWFLWRIHIENWWLLGRIVDVRPDKKGFDATRSSQIQTNAVKSILGATGNVSDVMLFFINNGELEVLLKCLPKRKPFEDS